MYKRQGVFTIEGSSAGNRAAQFLMANHNYETKARLGHEWVLAKRGLYR